MVGVELSPARELLRHTQLAAPRTPCVPTTIRAGLTSTSDDGSNPPSFPMAATSLACHLMLDLPATGCLVQEKVEGLAIHGAGDARVVHDNDGVDDSNGAPQLRHFE
jgi:hypothetical protein